MYVVKTLVFMLSVPTYTTLIYDRFLGEWNQ